MTTIWGEIHLLGHVTLRGSIRPCEDLPGLFVIETVGLPERAAPARGYILPAIPAERIIVGPGAIYRIEPLHREAVVERARQWTVRDLRWAGDGPDPDETPF